ncbi:MAG: hypothetical protein ABJB03_02605 [Rhodoglobus sp.]
MTSPESFPKSDAGSGSYKQYKYDLVPANKRVTMRLAGSDPCQEELRRVALSTVEAFIAKRTIEEERTDAPVAVRFFVDSRMTSIVGYVPRGLEAVALEAVSRLEKTGRNSRIPAQIVKTRGGLRVDLLMGLTR